MPKNFVGSEGQACIRQQRMSAATDVLGQYSAAAGAVEFLFTIESVQRNNENLQVTKAPFVRIMRRMDQNVPAITIRRVGICVPQIRAARAWVLLLKNFIRK
jgi:hypothetical protein